MEMIVREKGPVTVVALSGRLDLASGSSLKEQVKKLFAKNETTVHLNLAQVEFINSSGLGALVSIMKEVRLAKGRLDLVKPGELRPGDLRHHPAVAHLRDLLRPKKKRWRRFRRSSVR